MNPFYHARSSARKWGGKPESYKEVHDFLDHTKAHLAEMKHRAVLHNSWGIFMAEKMFGDVIEVPGEYTTREIPVRLVAERHVVEDLGWIPTLEDYLKNMTAKPWMAGSYKKFDEKKADVEIPLPSIEDVMERMNVDFR